jgi:hypothetical protein
MGARIAGFSPRTKVNRMRLSRPLRRASPAGRSQIAAALFTQMLGNLDPGQLAWPVKKFDRLRGACGHPRCVPQCRCSGRTSRPGDGVENRNIKTYASRLV